MARYVDLTLKNLPVAPVLAVEVLSESTALNDLNNKKAVYERITIVPARLLDGLRP